MIKSDAYTKTVLTLIAIGLFALVAQNSLSQLRAEDSKLQRVQICDGHQCLALTAVRRQTSFGERFATYAMPTFAEQEDR